MKFHSMTSSYLSNRGTTFSQTVTLLIMHFCRRHEEHSRLYKHTHSAQRWLLKLFYNSVGGWITSVKQNFWLPKFLTSHHTRTHRATFYIQNTLRKLMI